MGHNNLVVTKTKNKIKMKTIMQNTVGELGELQEQIVFQQDGPIMKWVLFQ